MIKAFSTIEFGLRGQSGGFYEEGGAKEARGLVKEGSKAGEERENSHFLVPPSPGGCLQGGGGVCHDDTRFLKVALRLLRNLPTITALLSWGALKLASSPEFSWSSIRRPVLNKTDLIL